MCWDELFAHPIFQGYFLAKSNGHQDFENKLKTVMSDLRFQINSNNLDLCKILASLGYSSDTTELNQHKFYQFLRVVNPKITKEESDYIFEKTDKDKNGFVSIN